MAPRYAGCEDPDGFVRSVINRSPPHEYADPIYRDLINAMSTRVQSDLSDETGYPQSTISGFWTGARRNQRFKFIQDLANALGYDLVLIPRSTKHDD